MRTLAIALLFGVTCAAEVRTICVSDHVRLGEVARQAFDREFEKLLGSADVHSLSAPCAAPSIRLAIFSTPPERYSNALGLAYRSGPVVLPELRIYLQTVLKTLGNERGAAIVGRALARVAAHELTHYLAQRLDHDCRGGMAGTFSGDRLAMADSASFRIVR